MSRNVWVSAAVLALITVGLQVSFAQPVAREEAWLKQNYRFTGPPAPGTVQPTDPVVSELWRVQDDIRWIYWRAKSYDDFPTALVAAGQMGANAMAIAGVKEREEEAAAAKEAAAAAKAYAAQARANAAANAPAPLYLIAFLDHTIAAATRYWTDGPTLHYVTAEGTHQQARLDQVDRSLSARLNQEAHLEFHLPE
jgi:hypothetical protein